MNSLKMVDPTQISTPPTGLEFWKFALSNNPTFFLLLLMIVILMILIVILITHKVKKRAKETNKD